MSTQKHLTATKNPTRLGGVLTVVTLGESYIVLNPPISPINPATGRNPSFFAAFRETF
jgi:hypothetical protein